MTAEFPHEPGERPGSQRDPADPAASYGRPEPAPFSAPDAPPYAPAGGYAGYWTTAAPSAVLPAPPRRDRSRGLVGLGAGLVAAAAVFGLALASGATQLTDGTATTAIGAAPQAPANRGPSTTLPGTTNPGGTSNSGGAASGGSRGSASSSGSATPAQSRGVVDIYTVQGYQQAAAAGTGMILTSDGQVLTNNHVIDGATTIKATVVSTGRTYTAKVVGTVPTKDVAVLKLQDASGLATVALGTSTSVRVGDTVVGVGNAGGVGGTPSAATGKVLALGKTISASDELGTSSEKLHNVIVTDAPIRSGDSGGPLYDAAGKVIGMDTAAGTNGPTRGFAIPIDDALALVRQIASGVQTSSVHIGYPGFLAITMMPGTTRPEIYEVIAGGPASRAGLQSGDLITQVDGDPVRTQTGLRSVISTKTPGTKVSVTYRDPVGSSHTATVTLAQGPAD